MVSTTTRPLAPEHTSPAVEDTCDRRLCFGDFGLLTPSGELFRRRRQGRWRPVKLQPQPARLLLYLAERAGALVSRAELQRHLWGDDYFVDHEQGLNYCVRAVRIALGDDAGAPVFLETVPRHGYRFLPRVEIEEVEAGDRGPRGDARELRARRHRASSGSRAALTLAGVVAVGLCLSWALSWWRSE